MHPSYPYGNPTNIKHPAAKPRPPYDPFSRALFEDMGYAGGGVNGTLRWRDVALDDLLPIEEDKEEAKRALQARKMAMGASSGAAQARRTVSTVQYRNGRPWHIEGVEVADEDENEIDEVEEDEVDEEDEDQIAEVDDDETEDAGYNSRSEAD